MRSPRPNKGLKPIAISPAPRRQTWNRENYSEAQVTITPLPVAIIYTNQLIERREENGPQIYRYVLNDPEDNLILHSETNKG